MPAEKSMDFMGSTKRLLGRCGRNGDARFVVVLGITSVTLT